ncbi:MAG TPA: hypothetical protein VK430_11225 [Xanthobacteraceae bacterium]|nr:hypothetical protein [Xanthobacteraceae bacterium]
MTRDAELLRELKSLREELSAAQQKRMSQAAALSSAAAKTASPTTQPDDTAEEQQLHGELREFVDVIKDFVQETEKNISAHPAATAIGAMIVGILIGRLLSRH